MALQLPDEREAFVQSRTKTARIYVRLAAVSVLVRAAQLRYAEQFLWRSYLLGLLSAFLFAHAASVGSRWFGVKVEVRSSRIITSATMQSAIGSEDQNSSS